MEGTSSNLTLGRDESCRDVMYLAQQRQDIRGKHRRNLISDQMSELVQYGGATELEYKQHFP